MAKAAARTYTSKDLIRRLRIKYGDGRKHAVFEQVAAFTGFGANSWIDFAVVNLWPSSGMTRLAFEVKVSRSDFLREVNNANKNQWAKDMFHEFWFVAPEGVIQDVQELPENCGWMHPWGSGQLRIQRQAARKADPKLDDDLLASFCRSSQDEFEKRMRDIRQSTLDGSREHQTALRVRDAADTFARAFGIIFSSDDSAQAMLEKLQRCTVDLQTKKERAQVLSRMDDFQDGVLRMADMFLLFAHVGILEVNDAGKFINRSWGSEGVAVERAAKKGPLERKQADRADALMDLIQTRGRELLEPSDG